MPDAPASSPPYPHGALPAGTRLGEFEIRRVLGIGGFGIVYLAFDHLLEREVALKEYMPSSLVERNESLHVSLISQAHADTFALGLRSFVNEARLLARFDHPSLLKVHRFWEGNGTAYMAMALYKGRTVRDVRLALQVRPDEAWVRRILEPLLGAVEKLHSEDVYHRDIAPDNILIEADGRPVLLDFGAARRVITDRSQALTAILKPSYAPIEQYADVEGMKQGAWTDIYALGATMHFLLLGKPPPPAPGRSIQDTMPPLAQQDLPGCSNDFLRLVDWMLSPLPTDRPQTVGMVRDALAGRVQPPDRTPPSPFERTAPLLGPGGRDADDEATVLMPRGQTAYTPPADEATVVMPRPGQGGVTSHGGSTRAMQVPSPPRPPPAAAPPPSLDEDATVVAPYPTGLPTQRPSAAGVTRQMPMPPMTTTAAAPPSPAARAEPPRPASPVPMPAVDDPHTSAGGWMVPVLAGVAVALIVGGGLWWFLTRPIAPPVVAATPSAEVAPPVQPVLPPAQPASALSVDVVPATPAVEPPRPEPVATTPAPQPTATTATPQPADAAPARRPAPAPVTRPPAAAPTPAPATQAGPAPAPPPVAPTRPAPAPTPATAPPVADTRPPAPADDGPRSPSDRCARELPLVRLICIDLACNRSEFAKHPECIKLRAEQAQKRHLDGN